MSRKSFDSKTLRMYVSGYVLSVTLTAAAYVIVQAYIHAGRVTYLYDWTLATILVFAVIQLFVQLYFFLHIGEESRPRWRLTTLLFAVFVVVLVVFGSIWIMSNLNYHMSQTETNKYLQSQGDL